MNTVNLKKSVLIVTAAALLGSHTSSAQDANSQTDDILTKAPTLQKGREQRSASVQYNDLNLANPAGVRTLYRRIDTAAKNVCQPQPDIRNMLMHKDWQSCYDGALDRAVSSAQLPSLTRYHLAQTGRIGEQKTEVTKAH